MHPAEPCEAARPLRCPCRGGAGQTSWVATTAPRSVLSASLRQCEDDAAVRAAPAAKRTTGGGWVARRGTGTLDTGATAARSASVHREPTKMGPDRLVGRLRFKIAARSGRHTARATVRRRTSAPPPILGVRLPALGVVTQAPVFVGSRTAKRVMAGWALRSDSSARPHQRFLVSLPAKQRLRVARVTPRMAQQGGQGTGRAWALNECVRWRGD